MRWAFFARAFCISAWLSIVRVNNLTDDIIAPCNIMATDAPFIQNATSQPVNIEDANQLTTTNEVETKETLSTTHVDTHRTTINNQNAIQRKGPKVIKPLPPVHINSTWIGNQWIPPPGYRLYSAREMQSYFQQHSILWIGDSTARRTYGTMYGILNATRDPDDIESHHLDHPSVIDMNKMSVELTVPFPEICNKSGYSLCRRIPAYGADDRDRLYDLSDATCLASLVNMTANQTSQLWKDISNYTLIIFIIGPWELRDRCGPEKGWQKRVQSFLDSLYQHTEDSNTVFLWRTWGSIDFDIERKAKISWKRAFMYNEYFKELMNEHDEERKSQNKSLSAVSYIDWGQAMFPRSFPRSKRIRGDMQAHYGLEARLTFVQMLMNHLVERDRQQSQM